MLKDIKRPKVEGVSVAIARDCTGAGEFGWKVFLINTNDFGIESVMITSKGYGSLQGEEKKTSVLRHWFDKVLPKSFEMVEIIHPELFGLCNEFWVSYYRSTEIFDKKFIFLPDSIKDENLMKIEILGREGVLHY
jgi:hypothetical protein